jgi:hypothetical protein
LPIPIGILLINAVLLGYSALTGLWASWIFLGPLDLGLVLWVAFYTLNLVRKHDSISPFAGQLGRRAGLLSAVVASALILLAIFVHAGQQLIGLIF